MKLFVLTKDIAAHGRSRGTGCRAPQAIRQASESICSSLLIRVLDRAEVGHDKVFLFPLQTKNPVFKKDRCQRGGEIGMRTEAEIPQACLHKEAWHSLVLHYT